MVGLQKEGGLFLYTLNDMENHIDPIILTYIQDQCAKKVFDRSEITEVETTKNRPSYKSVLFYKYVLDDKKYKSRVRDFFINNVLSEIEPKTKKRRELGHNVTQKEFFNTIFRDNFSHRNGESDKKGRKIYMRSFLVDIDSQSKTIQGKTSTYNLEKLIKKAKKYDYFTPNMFISHQFFTKEMLTLLGVIVFDFDLDTVGVHLTKEELYYHIKDKLHIPPAMIWDTKTQGNYQACILIENMTGTPASVHLYEQVVKEMIYKLEISDIACANANHIFSIAKNNARKGRVVRKYSHEIHNINAFRWLLNERDERRKREQSKNIQVLDFTKEAVKKHPAIKALFEAENISWRNHACFTLALVMKFLEESEEQAENYILSQWQPKVQNDGPHKFTQTEALKCIRHAYSGKYKCFHSHWIEVCTGLECNLKGYFRVPYESKGIYVTDTETRFREFLSKNENVFEGSIADLVKILGVKRRTLEALIYKLKDSGELQYETKRGRGAKTTFELKAEQQLEAVIARDNIFDLHVELTQIEELEDAINTLTAI